MTLFRHGVASGDPAADRVVIWTRVTTPAEATPVSWEMARDPRFGDIVAAGTVAAWRSAWGTVSIDVGGLEPATAYYYRFEAGGLRSPTGRTRTLPAGTCEHLRFAVCSCAKYTAGYFNAYASIAARNDLDFVLHLGDYIYESRSKDGKAAGAAIGRATDPLGECRTLDDYRRRYAHYRSDPDLVALHARHPIIATIDDHEVCDNAWKDGSRDHKQKREGAWSARKSAALQAWREWIPVRLPQPGRPERIFRAFSLGDLADLFVLDERSYRDRQARARAKMKKKSRTMLGSEQYRWLTNGLSQSNATWRLVGNTVMIGQAYTKHLPKAVARPLAAAGVLSKRDLGPAPDQWDGYPRERARLLRRLREIDNVLFLSGDAHTAWAIELKLDPADEDERPVAVEFIAPSITSENLDEHTRASRSEIDEIEQRVARSIPHVRWVDLDDHGWMLVDVTRDRVRTEWHFVADLKTRCERERPTTQWEVRSGEARIVPSGEALALDEQRRPGGLYATWSRRPGL